MESGGGDVFSKHKPHRARHSGKKAERKKDKNAANLDNVDPKIRNPKAFAINKVVNAERRFRRKQDVDTKKERIPTVDRTPVEPPPFIIAIVGPPKVGKSTLFRNLIKNFTRQTLTDIKGPVTIVSGKKRRLTLMECNNDLNSMIDVAKIADLVLLLIDASFGFEMEVFEFLNICQVHGFPQIMGVLTHLDTFKNKTQLKKTKKTLKHRFWTEVYPGSKLFYLSGYYPNTDAYPKNEIHNLSRFVSVMKFRPTLWRSEHSHVLVDRMEDLTSLESIRVNPKVDRTISVYGYVHGTYLKSHVSVHIPGLGDYKPQAITSLLDPCPLPMKERTFKRSLNEKEKVMYAPFCGVGGIVYDQDAVYIDLGGSHSHKRKRDDLSSEATESTPTPFVDELRGLTTTINEKIESAGLKLFSGSTEIKETDMEKMDATEEIENDESENDEDEKNGEEVETERPSVKERNFSVVKGDDGRIRRKVIFDNDKRVMDDDVTVEIQAEIESLKASASREENPNESDSENDSESEDGMTEAIEDEMVDEEHINFDGDHKEESENKEKAKYPKKAIQKLKDGPMMDSIKRPMKNQKHQAAVVSSQKDEFQFEGESSSSDSDDEIGVNSTSTNDQMNEKSFLRNEESPDGLSDKNDKVSSESEGDIGLDSGGDDDDSESGETDNEDELDGQEGKVISDKEMRMANAETAFYSRIRSRSLQKMIYDPAEDYLNVTSRADFDHANIAARENVGELEEDGLKDLFVGGDYAETAKKILDADDEDDEDVFGDFEMLDEDEPDERESKPKNESERQELKKKLKEKFDMEYDEGKDGKSFYQEWKGVMEEQAKSNRQFFEEIDDPKLLEELRGYAPGTYVRIEIGGIPCEFVVKFEPQARSPLIVGSLDSANQETLAIVQARVKKHRWHPKILKSRDPIIMSVGWRRFQTMALYSVHDHNMRNRMIKYTPEHLHCIANFYGPMTPQGTGILGIAPDGFNGFRITMTGTILDMDKSAELVKKLKLVGAPSEVFKKSAFIKGMFNSRLEVGKFVGARIKTVSGIRGVVKRPLQAPPGAFRATFEDKIVMSDIVFCRTWVTVEIPKFFLNISNHIDDKPRLMKTLGQLKREQGLRVQPNTDSMYTEIERKEKTFKPLKVPKSLQAKLPYKEKPKVQAKQSALKRIAVVKEPHERKMTKFINTLKSRLHEKEQREKEEKSKRYEEHSRKTKKAEEELTKRQKELKKKVFKTLEKINKKKSNVSSSSNRGSKFRGKRGKT